MTVQTKQANGSKEIARRAFLGHLTALPVVGTLGVSLIAGRADAGAAALIRQIDAAEQRSLQAQAAFAAALKAYEADYPPLHPSLDLTGLWSGGVTSRYELGPYGENVWRGYDATGRKMARMIATVGTISHDLKRATAAGQVWRTRNLRRMRRHAGKHEMACRRLDDRLGLFAAYTENMSADRAMEELCAAVFERAASTASEVRVQAVMLRAYCNTADKVDGLMKGWRATISCRYGEKLACNLAHLATAA